MDSRISWSVTEGARDEADVSFLAPAEQERLRGMRFPKRRAEWLNGRFAAKTLARQASPDLARLDLNQIRIETEPEGAPYLVVDGQGRLPGCISISHRDRVAFCALTFTPGLRLGADVELVEPHAAAFVEDFFTGREAERIARLAPELREVWVAAAWSAKEAVLKALGVGLRLDTRKVEVLGLAGLEGEATGWQAVEFDLSVPGRGEWSVWWQRWGEYVLTMTVLT